MFRKKNGSIGKDRFPSIISWTQVESKDKNSQLIYCYPRQNDNIKKGKFFNVKEHERAIYLKHGELIAELSGGTYELEKKSRVKGTEIIWFDTSMHQIFWGIPKINGIPSRDGFIFGMFGDLKLNIYNVNIFYKYVIGGNKEWSLQQMKDWIISLFHVVLRDIFKEYDISEIFQESRDIIMNKVVSKVCEEMNLYGLELDAFNILGFKPPDNAKEILNSKQEQAYRFKNWLENEKKRDIEDRIFIQYRIKSLKSRLQGLQNDLLENKITREAYDSKRQTINEFIEEANSELEPDNRYEK
ncbi:SPFH domain-containing protein [Promethearchaeum syntrophicum]|uniref:SPFH domain-containing protein n=1 Tax=Promethearchaeum syntrophicum TaxID=2594042 RepID=A0A5B9D9U7_9ARCH|nr:SPFH domain-containing protein [Candidatus Prometheoarchaeum syntrophicum]QEE15705.1 SPFH domain / Band 7 family protein [Candidatus Prometheoarchaeum syntrophicum]